MSIVFHVWPVSLLQYNNNCSPCQSPGRVEYLYDVCIIMDKGRLTDAAHSLRVLAAIPSGPDADFSDKVLKYYRLLILRNLLP